MALPLSLDMGKHFVEMGKPNEKSLPVPHTSCLRASLPLGTWAVLLTRGNGFRGALCWNIGSTSLDLPLLQMEQLAKQMDSQFSQRKGRYLMYHGGKEGRVFQADGKAGKKARSVLFGALGT